VPPDRVRCTRGLQAELLIFGNFQRRSTIIHRTVRCTTGQCPVPQGRATLNSPASGIRSAKIHRIVRCGSGAMAISHATVDCNALNARLRAQRSRARAGGTPNSLQGLSGAPPDSQARHATAAFQRPLCGGWGYKYPNHPTFIGIQVFPLLHLTRASIQYKTHQSNQILSQFHKKPK
jgi:hypothetical protein